LQYLTKKKCTSFVSQEAPITIVFLFSNSVKHLEKREVLGHTNVKSLDTKIKVLLLLFIASSKYLFSSCHPFLRWRLLQTFLPTNDIIIFFIVRLFGAKVDHKATL
jgi:hypothetical protein